MVLTIDAEDVEVTAAGDDLANVRRANRKVGLPSARPIGKTNVRHALATRPCHEHERPELQIRFTPYRLVNLKRHVRHLHARYLVPRRRVERGNANLAVPPQGE